MIKLCIVCFVVCVCFVNSSAQARVRFNDSQWTMMDRYDKIQEGPNTAIICDDANNTIFAPGEEFACGLYSSKGFVADLTKREIFPIKEYFDEHDFESRREHLARNLYFKDGYARLEILRAAHEKLRNEDRITYDSENSRNKYLRGNQANESTGLTREFETRNAAKDPDSFNPKMAILKSQREHPEYNDTHAQADTDDKLANLIAKYENNDSDKLVSKYQPPLPQIQKREQVERNHLDRDTITEQKRKELNSIASRIILCNRQTVSAYQAIDREREITQVSGYENKLFMRQAEEIIANCQNSIKRDFDDYRRKGGSRSLANLK